ncbi:MAG: hypothetical protein Pyrs2KO_26680 [Pyruvatibacter sp.]
MEIEAEAFCRLNCVIGQLLALLEMGSNIPEGAGGTLGEMERLLDSTEWTSSKKQIARIKESILSDDNLTNEKLRASVMSLYDRLRDELDSKKFLYVADRLEPFYSQPQPLFGERVETVLGAEAAEDISEAGKCLALGRCTAAVFHLMRMMERAVHLLADRLGATVINVNGQTLTWGVILANMDDKIRAMSGEEAQSWSEVRALLYSVNRAWRTETMHPKRTYTEEQAREVFDACRAFARNFAELV